MKMTWWLTTSLGAISAVLVYVLKELPPETPELVETLIVGFNAVLVGILGLTHSGHAVVTPKKAAEVFFEIARKVNK
ncbi:MAG: hypothetical protein V3W09_04325 [Nitrososphaerales archaeon]